MTESHIGATLYISTTLPATNDTAGFESLSWTKVSGLIQEPQLGLSHSAIDVPELESGFTQALKGAAQGNESTITFRDVDGDTGQTDLLSAARGRPGDVAIKVGYGTGANYALTSGDEVKYAQGIVMSPLLNQGGNDSYKGFQVTFRQNAEEVIGTEPGV